MIDTHTYPFSIYIHIPFCSHRCAYCDFNTYAGREHLIPAYVDALCTEIRMVATSSPERLPVHTIYFGGGTPSLLSPQQFKQILQTIRDHFLIDSPESLDSALPMETSLEANPGTVTLESLQGMRQAGINRISFGVQSFQTDELRQLERIHDPFDVVEAVQWARKAGFENINLDLIYGLPEQTLSRWQETLRRAINLAPEHLSLYALTIEHGTPFGRWVASGLMLAPDPDLAADMYEWASDYLAGQGYEQYEISNWSKPGFQCSHNLQYWRNQHYLGFGAGAHGCANGLRIANVRHIRAYIEHLSFDNLSSARRFPLSSATTIQVKLTPYMEMQETMLLGLRLTQEGVAPLTFHARFGQDLMVVFRKEVDELIGLGLIEGVRASKTSKLLEVYRLTCRGRMLGNQVFMRFVG
jgi:oxygen-independent coproporphyrinogen-3 oxidase